MYELFAFANDLNPILQGVLSGLVAFLAVFLFRGFYFWLTGTSLILYELRELNTNLKDIKELQAKDYEIQRGIYSLEEANRNNLQDINANIEQLVFIWE